MATMIDEESLNEPKRTSLLDIMDEKMRSGNKKRILHRVVFISTIQSEDIDKAAIGNHYDGLYKNLHSHHQGELMSGLMLIYPAHCLQVVESSSEMLLGLLRDILADEEDANGFFTSTKMLNISHDIPSRFFSQWTYRVLDMQLQNIDLYEPSDDVVKMVTDLLCQVNKLSSHISHLPKLNYKNTLDNLREKVPDLLPQQMIVGYLASLDDKCMIDIRQFVGYYQKPYDVVLEGELVWPMPIRLFPYN